MIDTNVLERAIRMHVRFETARGDLMVEDLWDLPLQSVQGTRANLDDIARGLNKKLKDGADESFVDTTFKGDIETQLKFDIVRHVIEVRVAERNAAKTESERAAKKQHILSILADKQSETLRNMSTEDLQKLLVEL